MLIDFHTHTSASDGELLPAALMARAVNRDVRALAITDHDTLEGLKSAASNVPKSLQLVSGVELSCLWGGVNIHIVGLGFDMTAPAMTALVARQGAAREQRAHKIAQRLEQAGFQGAYDGVVALASGAELGRPHFARWLVKQGFVDSETRAFDRYLGRGKLGDVKTFWPALSDVVAELTSAGGVAILAHPLHYSMTRMKLRALCTDFAEAGGSAIEIASGRQTQDEIAKLTRLALDFGLHASVGSDFHRPWQHGPDLGVSTTLARGVPGVWEIVL